MKWAGLPALWVLSVACNVSPTQSGSTGGIGDAAQPDGGTTPAGDGSGAPVLDGGDAGNGSAGDAGDAGAPAACDRGTTVLLTDFVSTQIALAALDGTVLSDDFLSTATTKASSDAFPLSGDVLLPRETPPSGRVVLIDSFGTDVITWADPATANVYAQLPVGTGFESDPWDYIEVDATSAYVSRYGVNDAPGSQPFDDGSDLLVVDTTNYSIAGSIPMPVESGLPPRPASMLRVGDTIIVVLQRFSANFTTAGESALVGIQNGAIAWEVHASGLVACDHPTLSPSGRTIAIACAGLLSASGSVENDSATGIQLYDVTTLPPTPTKEYPVYDQLGSTVQPDVTWVSETMLLGKTQTPTGSSAYNQAFTLDLATGTASVLQTARTAGLVYGDVLCRPNCTGVCLLANMDDGKLDRWMITDGGLSPLPAIEVDPTTGLPPSLLGGY
jgi:hypothetical protein